jgi:hypothetical protein
MPIEVTTMAREVIVSLLLASLTLLAALANLLVKKGINWVQAQTDKAQDESLRNLFNAALLRLNDVTAKTVNKIEQTSKKQFLKAIEAGEMDKDVLKTLAQDAYAEIIKTMEPDYMQLITETMGDAKTYIYNLIEEKLEEVKRRQSYVDVDLGDIDGVSSVVTS